MTEPVEVKDGELLIAVTFDPVEQRITSIQFDLEKIKTLDFAAAVLGMGHEEAKNQARQGKPEALEGLAAFIAQKVQDNARNNSDLNGQAADGR